MKSNSDWSGFITKVAPDSEKVFKCRRIDLRAEGRFLHNFFSGVKFDQCSFGGKYATARETLHLLDISRHENMFHFLPRTCMDLPDAGEMLGGSFLVNINYVSVGNSI